jgi:hypothetical protein
VIRSVLLFLAVCLLVVACGIGRQPPMLIGWIDGTGSAQQDSIALCERRAREVTTQVARAEGVAILERLDAATANAPTFQVTRKFKVPGEIAANPARIEEKHRQDVDALFRQLAPVLARPPSGSTDVVGALGASGARLRDHEGDRFLYICSDLGDRRLLRLGTIDRHRVDALLDRMRRRGDVPKLYGATVVLDTTSAVARDRLGPAEQAAIEHFYRALIEAGGGQLAGYGTATSLPLT